MKDEKSEKGRGCQRERVPRPGGRKRTGLVVLEDGLERDENLRIPALANAPSLKDARQPAQPSAPQGYRTTDEQAQRQGVVPPTHGTAVPLQQC